MKNKKSGNKGNPIYNPRSDQRIHQTALYALSGLSFFGLLAITALYFIHQEVPESLTVLTTVSITAIATLFKERGNPES